MRCATCGKRVSSAFYEAPDGALHCIKCAAKLPPELPQPPPKLTEPEPVGTQETEPEHCPKCDLISPPGTEYCDCGFDLSGKGRLRPGRRSREAPHSPPKPTKPPQQPFQYAEPEQDLEEAPNDYHLASSIASAIDGIVATDGLDSLLNGDWWVGLRMTFGVSLSTIKPQAGMRAIVRLNDLEEEYGLFKRIHSPSNLYGNGPLQHMATDRLAMAILVEMQKQMREMDTAAQSDLGMRGDKGKDVSDVEEGLSTAESWKREITYEADVDVGKVFKKMRKLRISRDGVEWEGRLIPLGEITRLRWGETQYKMAFSGVKTDASYSVFIGTQQDDITIEFGDWTSRPPGSSCRSLPVHTAKQVYSELIDHLWRAVGVRLLIEFLQGLRDGQRYHFGTTVVDDYGVELDRSHWFSSNERIRCSWREIRFYSSNGYLCIETNNKSNSKDSAGLSLSYEHMDNVHVLEAAINSMDSQLSAYNALLSIAREPDEPASRRVTAGKTAHRLYVSQKTKGRRLSHTLDLLFPDHA